MSVNPARVNRRGSWRPILPWTAASVNVSRMIRVVGGIGVIEEGGAQVQLQRRHLAAGRVTRAISRTRHVDAGAAACPGRRPRSGRCRRTPRSRAACRRAGQVRRARRAPRCARHGLLRRFGRVLDRQVAAGEPVPVQRPNPAQRASCGQRRRPAGEQDALPRVHLLVVGHLDRADHRPDSQPQAPAGPGRHSPGAFPDTAVRASARGPDDARVWRARRPCPRPRASAAGPRSSDADTIHH